MMKPITITKLAKESIFDAARRASNQATINNKIVEYKDGDYTILVYPNDIINNVIMAIKKIALMVEVAYLQGVIAAK